jgi:hypothetical protein
MTTTQAGDVVVVRGEEELFARAGHLFESATDCACAANDLYTWAAAKRGPGPGRMPAGRRVRKLYRPAALLEPASARRLHELARAGAEVRISPNEVNETIIFDRRIAILAGDAPHTYSVLLGAEAVQGVASLFDAAWRGGSELAVHDARVSEIRALAPRILELLATGCKDETAARRLGLSLRTYRRRVAELMDTLGATSRFQAGARARELGLV